MRSSKTGRASRLVDGQVVVVDFYPDTGCIKFSDESGAAHELRPPHSWLEMSRAARQARSASSSSQGELEVLLNDFCARSAEYLRTRAQRRVAAGGLQRVLAEADA